MEKIIYVSQGDVYKVNKLLEEGWSVKMIVCAPTVGGELCFKSVDAYVVLTDNRKEES